MAGNMKIFLESQVGIGSKRSHATSSDRCSFSGASADEHAIAHSGRVFSSLSQAANSPLSVLSRHRQSQPGEKRASASPSSRYLSQNDIFMAEITYVDDPFTMTSSTTSPTSISTFESLSSSASHMITTNQPSRQRSRLGAIAAN